MQIPFRTTLSLPLLLLALSACSSAPAPSEPLDSQANVTTATAEGVAGGIIQASERVTATVVEINQSKRTFVLQDDAGHRRQIAAPAEMINFPQLKVGDVVDAEVTIETLIYVADAADVPADGGEGLAVAAAEGEKPGVLAAQQEQISATVIAVDVENHSATLELADGSLRTVPVRPDVSISPKDVGKKVVTVITSAVAVNVASAN